MEKQANIRINYLLNTFNQVLSLIVPLITAPYLSRVLGSEGIGIQSYTNSIITYYTLIAVLGTSSFGQRNTAYHRDNKQELSRAFWENFFLRVITTTVALIFYAISISRDNQYPTIFAILTINIFNVIVDINWFYQGIECFKRIVLRSVAVRIIQTVMTFVLIKDKDDLVLYILLICLFTIIGNASMWIGLKEYIGGPHGVNPFRNIKAVVLLFLPTIATQVYAVLDKSMIGWITKSAYQNGCYEMSERIARMALTVITSFSTVILPRIANLYKRNRLEEAKEYVYLGYRFVWMLSLPMMFGLIGISSVFVPVFFGDGYDLASILLPIFSVLVVAVSLAHVTGYAYLIPTEQQNVYTIAVSIAACFNLFMNLLLIRSIGAIGAALGSITAEILGVAIQMIYCIKNKQLMMKKVFDGFILYLIASIIMLLGLQFIKKVLPSNILSLALLLIFGSITYFILLLIAKDSFLMTNIKRVKQKFIK